MKHQLIAAALFAAILPGVALAEEDDGAAEARRQYQSGTTAYAAKRFNEAALAFEAAAAYKANGVTLYTAALAWEQANAPERAADAYSRALEAAGLTPQQQATAKDRVSALEKTLGTLVVTGPEGFKVQLDALSVAPVPARLHGSPGMHTIVIRGAQRAPDKRDVTLELGQTTNLDASPKKVDPPKPKDDDKPKVITVEVEGPPRLSWRKAAGFGAIGLGAMSCISGALLGSSALDAADAYNAAPSRSGFDHANSLATWSTVTWIAGGVFVAGGVALVLVPEQKAAGKATDTGRDKDDDKSPDKHENLELPPKEPALSLLPTPGGAMLRGSF